MATKTTQAAPAPSTPNLSATLDIVAKDKGIERSVLVNTLENAILSAARKHLGGDRELVAKYNERAGVVDLFQYMSVVDVVARPDAEMELDVAQRMDPGAEVGDQLAFQVYYLPEDSRKAEEQDAQHQALEAVHHVASPFARAPRLGPERVLVGAGEADRITPRIHAERLARHFGAPLVTFGGGHLLQFGRGAVFREVGRMLGRLGLFPTAAR